MVTIKLKSFSFIESTTMMWYVDYVTELAELLHE